VTIVNWQGSAIFGPGSEWFWSMAQFIVVVVSLLGIYRQLTIARSANAFEQMSNIAMEWGSERNTRYRLEVLIALRGGAGPREIPFGAAAQLSDYWDYVGALVRARHVDRTLVYQNLGVDIRSWWATLAPWVRNYRIESGDPTGVAHFEWLAGLMADMSTKAGVAMTFDEAFLASTLDRRIKRGQEEVRLAEELRAVIVQRATRQRSPGHARRRSRTSPSK
jgi:hypothetical protein